MERISQKTGNDLKAGTGKSDIGGVEEFVRSDGAIFRWNPGAAKSGEGMKIIVGSAGQGRTVFLNREKIEDSTGDKNCQSIK